jgi:response regulator RpfG family c-di-GMP phosphodiesterase
VRSQAGKHFDPRLVDAFAAMAKDVLQIQDEWRDPLQGE